MPATISAKSILLHHVMMRREIKHMVQQVRTLRISLKAGLIRSQNGVLLFLLPESIVNLKTERLRFASDYKELYFTRCEAGKREKKGCVIMFSDRSGDKWSEPKNLGLLPDSMVAAHPAMTTDGKTFIFCFRYDRRFWRKRYLDCHPCKWGRWMVKTAQSGPDINTPGDELFPLCQGRRYTLFLL